MTARSAAAGSTGPALTADQVRAYRIAASGLDRQTGNALDLPLWELGVQDTAGSARLALANRLGPGTPFPKIGEPGERDGLVAAWTLRGSPHWHRRADLPALAAALWPADARDAAARLSGSAKRLHELDSDPATAYRVAADALRAVVTAPMTKGEASAAVTAALPRGYSGWCAGCGSDHVFEMLFRSAALPAAVGLVPETKPVVLAPVRPSFDRPSEPGGSADLLAAYFRQYGAGTATDIATQLGTSAAVLRPELADAMPVTVDGRKALASPESAEALAGPHPTGTDRLVRLLGSSDPLLQPRDRRTLVAQPDRQKALWPILGAPGAVLAGGGLAGYWRGRLAGRALTLTITLWEPLDRWQRRELTAEADVIGRARGAARAELVFPD